ncbi:MAG: helix-turn-helix domain-containing protein [Actinomycetota bacterium]|nr:helix-turn-helix domain-containing protein [Actinomycetota bacterium]
MSYRNKADEVAYQRDRAHGRPRYVDAEPARRKLQQLLDADVPVRALSRNSGISAPAIHAIANGDRTHVHRKTAQQIAQLRLADIYEQPQTGLVPKVGAVRRLHALMAMGWTKDLLTEAGATSLPRVLSGPGNLITLAKWREIKDVYDHLSMTPGPSPQTKRRSLRRGYAPPLAWDDGTIDNRYSRPQTAEFLPAGTDTIDKVAVERAILRTGAATTLTPAERLEVVRAMAAAGASDPQIAQHLNVVDRTILRTRQRHGIPSALGTTPAPSETDWDSREARAITSPETDPSGDRGRPRTRVHDISPPARSVRR